MVSPKDNSPPVNAIIIPSLAVNSASPKKQAKVPPHRIDA
ncbi:hypothetical protein CCACVL1_03614 [Corchorus capsularis]|uniref:Uncharacterized protein n=1 Tax=Corchorus capsularis TaxID=210143 RepID=A0A1R3JYA7_COCAP|nr:hypothetical protein CCACVL1_03614 [Corchorus capsularis]